MEPRHQALLDDFAQYLAKHPDERFWQALRNWSGASKIIYEKDHGNDRYDSLDTFYWEGKNKDLEL